MDTVVPPLVKKGSFICVGSSDKKRWSFSLSVLPFVVDRMHQFGTVRLVFRKPLIFFTSE